VLVLRWVGLCQKEEVEERFPLSKARLQEEPVDVAIEVVLGLCD